jgi:type IV secretion system protein VirB6
MASCPGFDPLGPYVSQIVSFADCQSLALGAAGYRALGPSTGFGMAFLSALLTIHVALIGYRLLLGGQIGLREGVGAALRLGFVLALATQWSAYRPLVYDVITQGPVDLAVRVLAPSGLGGDAPERLIDRVQGACMRRWAN